MQSLENTDIIKNGSDDEFMTDVIEASKEMPIIVDFWAPWCGPCKSIGPALEEAVKAHSNKIKLVKIDIDKYPGVAGQLRVQSIPAVFAFSNGQPVDGFMGAQTPAQIMEFIKKIVASFGSKNNPLEGALETAQELLSEKDYVQAVKVFKKIIGENESLPEGHVGLIKCFLGLKDLVSAKSALAEIPIDLQKDNSVKAVISQLKLAEKTNSAGNSEKLREKTELNPKDLKIRFDLAIALISEEKNNAAIDVLLLIIKENPGWNDGKAKTQLIELLDSLGPSDKDGRRGRRLLSSLIFS